MNEFVREAKRRENELLTKKKFVAADQTADVSARGIAVGEGKPTAEIEAEDSERLPTQIVELDAQLADAKDYRIALEDDRQADSGRRAGFAEANRRDRNRPEAACATTCQARSTSTGEWINRAPVLDALYTGNIKLDQIWLPDMKINYNFSSVARYDRCIVCHRAIDKTAPGSADRAGLSGDSARRARANRCSWPRRPKRRNRR